MELILNSINELKIVNYEFLNKLRYTIRKQESSELLRLLGEFMMKIFTKRPRSSNIKLYQFTYFFAISSIADTSRKFDWSARLIKRLEKPLKATLNQLFTKINRPPLSNKYSLYSKIDWGVVRDICANGALISPVEENNASEGNRSIKQKHSTARNPKSNREEKHRQKQEDNLMGKKEGKLTKWVKKFLEQYKDQIIDLTMDQLDDFVNDIADDLKDFLLEHIPSNPFTNVSINLGTPKLLKTVIKKMIEHQYDNLTADDEVDDEGEEWEDNEVSYEGYDGDNKNYEEDMVDEGYSNWKRGSSYDYDPEYDHYRPNAIAEWEEFYDPWNVTRSRIFTPPIKFQIIGMIKVGKCIPIYHISQLVTLDPEDIKMLIYELVGEGLILGQFEGLKFYISTNMQESANRFLKVLQAKLG